jgi:sugar phosphate isomerase/epimerase
LRYGVDLITLYDPAFWGLSDFNSFYNTEILTPEVFWDRALDTVAASGIEGVEITFGPAHWRNALARYGTAEAFREAVQRRGLTVCSGFYTGLVLGGDWRAPGREEVLVAEVAEYAEFLAEAECEIMIAGLPMRSTWDSDAPQFVDMAYAADLARVLNRLGYETLRRGVKLAIHPETHAVLWFQRDIDLFLELTDPVYVWFCPDTAHISLGGTNPSQVVRDHASRILISHWKDVRGRPPIHMGIDENIFRSHHPFFSRIGTGEVDWAEWARTLRDIRFEGWAILELDAAADPPSQISAAKAFVDTALEPIFN